MTIETKKKRPTHTIWQVVGDGEKSRWNRIGAGWKSDKGNWINLSLNVVPLTGRIVIGEARDLPGGKAKSVGKDGEH